MAFGTARDFLSAASDAVNAAEQVRRDTNEINPLVEYHLRRAELFARIGHGLATLDGTR